MEVALSSNQYSSAAKWLDVYGNDCCGAAPPCQRYCDYHKPFEVTDIAHSEACDRGAQNLNGVEQCRTCWDICVEHNTVLRGNAERDGGAVWVANEGVATCNVAPDLAREAGAYLHDLMQSYDIRARRYTFCPAAENIRGYDGFTLVHGDYDANEQAKSTCILFPSDVAVLQCESLRRLIVEHARLMPCDVYLGHSTLLWQKGANCASFGYHTDAAQENDDKERGSGRAMLTTVQLVWCSEDYEPTGVFVLGAAEIVQYKNIGDVTTFLADIVHKSVPAGKGGCIKLVHTWCLKETARNTLPPNVRHERTAILWMSQQEMLGVVEPTMALTESIYMSLKACNSMSACTRNAYDFLLLMCSGVLALVPWLQHEGGAEVSSQDLNYTLATIEGQIRQVLHSTIRVKARF